MTETEFRELQRRQREIGLNLKANLGHDGISAMLPNDVQMHFSQIMEEIALRFLSEKGGNHV